MDGIEEKRISKSAALYSGLLQAIALYLVYLSLSLTDPWGYMSPMGQLVIYMGLAMAMMIVIARGLMAKSDWTLKMSLKGVFLSVVLLSVAGIMAGSDSRRLLEIAVKPRAIFDYPVPEIIMTVTPPDYHGGKQFTQLMTMDALGMNPVPEGSNIMMRVQNTAYAPTLIAGQNRVEFLSSTDGGFTAQFTLKDETVWQVREGSLKMGEWPIIIQADEAPAIESVDFRQMLTGDGLIGLSLHLSDDYGLQEVAVGVVEAGSGAGALSDRAILKISGLKEFSGEAYLNFGASDFAGNTVDLIVEATDQAGQKKQKILSGIFLPAREFSNPHARKIIEIRHRIKTEPDIRKKLARQLMALGLVPDDGQTPTVYYMALRSAYWRLTKPKNDDDINSARDILWDLAVQMESGEAGQFSRDILALLASLKLSLYQEQEVPNVRKQLKEIDKAVIMYMRTQTAPKVGLSEQRKIEVKELRRIYGKILTHNHNKKFEKAAGLVSYLEHGFIYRDRDILTGQGFKRFQIVRQARDTVDIIKKSQRRVMSYIYKKSVKMELANLDINPAGTTDVPKISFGGDIHKWIAIQKKLGANVNNLGRMLVKSGIKTGHLTAAASDLASNAVNSMEAGDMEAAGGYQSEILTLLTRLKGILDMEMQYSPEG